MHRARIALLLLAVPGSLGPFAPRVSGADCNRNGIDDFTDITTGGAPDCNRNGVPDACDLQPVNYGLARRGSFGVGNFPASVILLDLDLDGDRDLATANLGSLDVTVLWNNGVGNFPPFTSVPVNRDARVLAAAEFGRGPLTDLAVATSEGLIILFQEPARRFTLSPPIAADPGIRSLAAGDLDGDGDGDVAAVAPFLVQVILTAGAGAPSSETIRIGSDPFVVLAAPIDNDADLDLVTANAIFAPVPAGNVSVFLNQGGARFAAARNFATGDGPTAMAAGDLDGDGDLDLVTANQAAAAQVDANGDGILDPAQGGDVSVLAGDGTGRFAETTRLPARDATVHLSLGDLDQDGDLDIVVLDMVLASAGGPGFPPLPIPLPQGTNSALSFFRNHGRGNFGQAVAFPAGLATKALAAGTAVGDLTGDGFPEVAALDVERSSVTVFEKDQVAYDLDCNATSIPDSCELADNDCNENAIPDECDIASGAASDCNRNTIPDSCETDCNENQSPDDCDLAAGRSQDCNANAVPDECDVRPGRAEFQAVPAGVTNAIPSRSLLPADLDGDGDQDLVELQEPGSLRIIRNGPGRSFAQPVEVSLPARGTAVAAADFEGDGDLDLAVTLPDSNLVALFIQTADRSFQAGESVVIEKGPAAVAAGDFDRDGDQDLAVIEAGNGSLVLLKNQQGSGKFDLLQSAPQVVSPNLLAARDVDADGALDLIVEFLQLGTAGVLWNDGQALFRDSSPFAEFGSVLPALADFDGDSDLDVALGGNGAVFILRNAGRRNFPRPTQVIDGLQGNVLVAADFDGDHDVDLAAGQLIDPTLGMAGGIEVLINAGDGSFVRKNQIAAPGLFLIAAAADFDEDEAMDLVASRIGICLRPDCFFESELTFLFNITVGQRSRDQNANRIPDECEGGLFHRGDIDGSGDLDLADPIRGLLALFAGGEQPACAEAADANNDARIDVTDMIGVLNYLFRGGSPPVAPGPPPAPCDWDPDPRGSPGDLGCTSYAGC